MFKKVVSRVILTLLICVEVVSLLNVQLAGSEELVVSSISGLKFVSCQTEVGGSSITVRNMIQLTFEPVYQANPSWSPDGSQIVYVQDPVDRPGMGDIWIMKADGSDKTPLVTNPAWDEGPSWAPDGSRIAFISNRYVWPGSIFIKDLITGDEISLPYEGSQNYVAHPKCWSPDGSKILFITNRITGEVDNCDLWIMNSDGSNQKPLTSGGGICGACFSPDGLKIVYSQNNDIYIMDADGGNKQKIIANGVQPVFSPDGRWIAFTRSEGYRVTNIWVAELENPSNQIQLTATNDARSPDWSPDGTKIAFTRGWDQEADIWVVEIELHYVRKIQATLDINPEALNLRSKGRWVTAYIELPEGYNVADINVSSILLNDTIPAELRPIAIGDYDNDSIPDLMMKFDRAKVIGYILNNVDLEQLFEERFMTVTLTVTGYLNNGTPFQGTDTIRIIYFTPRIWRFIQFL